MHDVRLLSGRAEAMDLNGPTPSPWEGKPRDEGYKFTKSCLFACLVGGVFWVALAWTVAEIVWR